MQLLLLTGMSGSGKSIALNALEDLGYYCVDNLPAKLLPEVVAYLHQSNHVHVAISIDVRSVETLPLLPQHILVLRHSGIEVQLMYLEASTDTLVKRYSETRRRHPLSDTELTLPEAISRERELLAEIAALAHHIDTSDLRPAQLRAWIRDFVNIERSGLTLLFQSFAFKNGLPLDADMVFDVRSLPNPFYDPKLRPLNGRDQPVIEFLASEASVRLMLSDIRGLLENWLPSFVRDNRSYLTVAIGCTGGQHRSVYLVEELARHFAPQIKVLVRHRELSET
ncbi:MAG: RNase adapter RapZ [Burkholderiales bacterium]|nr:RNase adapter RapZ [Burkholderiales bacterium]